ncbi:MAG TPA: hypothetical protein VLG72_06515 [Nitrospirota bacterium]|nr:hypothetical protein [Nitrospirota bacterium]
MRLEENWQAYVALRHGQIFERSILKLFEQLGLRRLFVLVLRRMQVTRNRLTRHHLTMKAGRMHPGR